LELYQRDLLVAQTSYEQAAARIRVVEDELKAIHNEAMKVATRHAIKVSSPTTHSMVRERSLNSMNQYLTQQMHIEILQILGGLDQIVSLQARKPPQQDEAVRGPSPKTDDSKIIVQ
jgi:hypothetical protein